MATMCPGCKEEILPAHVKDFVKQADGSHAVWHNTCNSDRLAAEKSERLHKAETRVTELEAQCSARAEWGIKLARVEAALDDLLMHAVEGPTKDWMMISKVEFDQAVQRLKK